MSNILTAMSGRFTEHVLTYPLGEADEDGIWRPDYYGQTVALARHLDGELYDLAGGCMGVARRVKPGQCGLSGRDDAPDGAEWEVFAYSPDANEYEEWTIAHWYMSDTEDITEPTEMPVVLVFHKEN